MFVKSIVCTVPVERAVSHSSVNHQTSQAKIKKIYRKRDSPFGEMALDVAGVKDSDRQAVSYLSTLWFMHCRVVWWCMVWRRAAVRRTVRGSVCGAEGLVRPARPHGGQACRGAVALRSAQPTHRSVA